MVSTTTSEHEGFLGLPDHDVLHWRALRPSLGEMLGDFLPCLGGEFHQSKVDLEGYISNNFIYHIYIYINIRMHIYIYVNSTH